MSGRREETTMSEQKTDTPVAEDESKKSRPIEDSEAEGVVGGATSQQYDRWHTLPDGSGSGAGE